MRIVKFFLLIFFILVNSQILFASSEKELRYKISKNIRCLICQGQSVYDSQSEFANSVKTLIDEKIEAGFTEDEIYYYLIEKYGQWIVYEPDFNKKTFILWTLPILLFLSGGAIIFRKFILKK